MKKTVLICIGIVALGGAWWFYHSNAVSQPVTVKIRLLASMGNQPLEFNSVQYANPGGEGRFTLRDAQFFISNLRFVHGQSQYRVQDSYHLVRFNGEKSEFEFPLQIPSNLKFDRLSLGIGVDPQANGKIYFAGDLDPNGRMAWSWDVGYKFLLLEGNLTHETGSIPLVYHVGFDENYTQISLPLTDTQLRESDNRVTLNVDFLSLFARNPAIDMSKVSTVKFDREDANHIAQGFNQFITLCNGACYENLENR